MPRPFPPGRVGLKAFLSAARISKNTFFLRYRHSSRWIALLDIDEDRDHRLHFPHDAGERLRILRHKKAHGNRGRRPQRPCPRCNAEAHPRHSHCPACEFLLQPADAAVVRPPASTAARNGSRRDKLRLAKELMTVGEAPDASPESRMAARR